MVTERVKCMDSKIKYLESFARSLDNEGTASTIDSYINDVKLFNRYLAEYDVYAEVYLHVFYSQTIRNRRYGNVYSQ